ncbi:SanA/YdcF family protein [Bacteroides acidifaciens]|uniref:SanA/YdcF family protein n=1 Tax=Bacteroides acidifaciens TaxID=85831 RepID=UPI00261CCD11|nr:ElyC/SanA/YdcF family protein [Bacteroides acidifaciens]
MRKRKIILWSLAIIGVFVASIAVCDIMVSRTTSGRTYDNVDSIPHRKVGMILGTSPISTWNGRRNYYFDHRIKAGADLYKAGKVDWLVVSGGDYRNNENGYDEPVAMRDSLMKQGVDSTRIILDYDGTRTLNSIAKMRDVYCQDSIILISQKYHNERALYQAKHLGIDAIGFNAKTPGKRISWWRNRGREVLARVKLFLDVVRGLHPDIKESVIRDFTDVDADVMSISHINTDYGDLICLRPDMTRLKMDMVCNKIPSPENDSIILAFAGAFTGTEFDKGHANVAGDHVAGGKRFNGYRCKRNTGAFTWSPVMGAQFHYKDYSSALDSAANEGGMGFAQEMMIHDGKAIQTTRPLGNRNVFRALCLDSNNQLALYESQGVVTFGNFIDALHSQGVKEALYTDMGQGWNYCFYRINQFDKSPECLHSKSLPYASNFIVLKIN